MYVPISVSSGWMSGAEGSMGALMAFFPSSWRSLTNEKKKQTHKNLFNSTEQQLNT